MSENIAIIEEQSRFPKTSGKPAVCHRSLKGLLAPLQQLVDRSTFLTFEELELSGGISIPRFVLTGPKGGGDAIRIGLFAGLHGDHVEGVYALVRFLSALSENPERATGFELSLYPVSNPTGFEDGMRLTRSGHDLNGEFWHNSRVPEVLALQQEILTRFFHGIISLQTDPASDGIYGLVRGASLTRHLLKSALAVAGQLLPLNAEDYINGIEARDGVVNNKGVGTFGAPANAQPRPFEITLALPKGVPESLKESAAVLALQTILDEYRQFISYAANL